MEPTITPILNDAPAPKSNKLKLAICFILTVIISAAVSGGAMWYSMDQQKGSSINKLNTQILAKEKSITDLTATIANLTPTTSPATTGSTTAAAPNDLATLQTFCTTGTTLTLSEVILETNSNGTFGSCGLSDDQSGVAKLAAKVNGTWTTVFTGNGDVSAATISKYKLPLSISRAYIAR